MQQNSSNALKVAVVGGGPAGLMAAEVLSQAGQAVNLFEAKPSVGRKFLVAGKGGLNLTHSEPFEPFLSRYGERAAQLEPYLRAFGPAELRQWAKELGFDTFVGTSGRVFPEGMRAAPLLRAWRLRLEAAGVDFHLRHRWLGWDMEGALRFSTPQGTSMFKPAALVLALGGGSWPQLGSDAAWVPWLKQRGVSIAPLRPANCGFDLHWSAHFRHRYAGQAVKNVVLTFVAQGGETFQRTGEFLVSAYGVEGSLIYAASAWLRDSLEVTGAAIPYLDLFPQWDRASLLKRLEHPRGSRSWSSYFRRTLGLSGVKASLVWEFVPQSLFDQPEPLVDRLKAMPLPLVAPRPLAEAISTAGGVRFEALDRRLMLRNVPGVFCAGEMLDWEAPTGGYLLTACFATGRAAGQGVLDWLAEQ
ncbi:MAG: TIGR03862 family flavoprotein [Anaerolineales bacterium]|nr:TIGR03862 family flavoprotein [Anaerolineales bacterium]